ncbi:MAG: class I SAM-dependent methyltransferase [Bacteroidetes bacterium]|nr:class I SAM-dependent methyltransferase [Bacteroidota bacterium]
MERINSNLFLEKPIIQSPRIRNFRLRFVLEFVLSIFCAFYVNLKGGWGIRFHLYVVKKSIIAFFKQKISLPELDSLAIIPLDSFRYFEFHFGRIFLKDLKIENYLDVSSPRFFPAYLIEHKKLAKATLVNPDKKDIEGTERIFKKFQLKGDIEFINGLIANVNQELESFDLITCISVLEHIPMEYFDASLKQIWALLKPGGFLLISVPVSKNAYDEYINYNEYELQEKSPDGYYFGQRFHSQKLIDQLFISYLGHPIKSKIAGEIENGYFNKNRFDKLNYVNYPRWKESIFFNENYKEYNSIDSLPGIGVEIFLFQKTSSINENCNI